MRPLSLWPWSALLYGNQPLSLYSIIKFLFDTMAGVEPFCTNNRVLCTRLDPDRQSGEHHHCGRRLQLGNLFVRVKSFMIMVEKTLGLLTRNNASFLNFLMESNCIQCGWHCGKKMETDKRTIRSSRKATLIAMCYLLYFLSYIFYQFFIYFTSQLLRIALPAICHRFLRIFTIY